MKVKVSDLKPNPFRNLKRLPLDPVVVDRLVGSIKETDFWDNLLGRKNGSGIEIAYGHHRVAALKKAGIKDVDLAVRKLSDEAMVKIMAHENAREWSHDAEFEVETVRATLEAAAAGKIELPTPGKSGTFRTCGKCEYTAATIAEFLGWQPYKVEAALGVIDSQEAGTIDDDTVRGLSTRQAEAVVTQVRRVAKSHGTKTAKAVGKSLAAGMRKGSGGRYISKSDAKAESITIHNARRKADELAGDRSQPPAKMPDIAEFSRNFEKQLGDALSGNNLLKMRQIVKYKEHLDADRKRSLIKTLRDLAKSAAQFAEDLA